MCGIFLVHAKTESLNLNRCIKCSIKIKDRGPDKLLSNYFKKKKLFMSNSILSITGSNKKNSSIYQSQNKKNFLIYNGEIYNWLKLKKKKKLSKCINDSDLLINLHQKYNHYEVPKKLNGMFAYCIFDLNKNKLNFCSDPQGEKKIFYYNDDKFFILSSNISSIITFVKQKLNINAIKNYLYTRHFLFFNETIFKKINIATPGYLYTFDLNKKILSNICFDNPINWINKNKYLNLSNKKEDEIINYLYKKFKKTLSYMIPNKKFASIFSGGVDSSLQTMLIKEIKEPDIIATLHHEKKDTITQKINIFEKYVKQKIYKIIVNKETYSNLLKKCFQITKFPLLTHDFVGKYQISNFFKKKKCKVLFTADGTDELFGGYKVYSKLNWKKNKTEVISPYTQNKSNDKTNEQKILINKLRDKVYNKYYFIKNKTERRMQTTLFLDYFIQSIYVGNIGTDIMCGANGIEPRNMYIQKEIIKEAINLPIKYKINIKSKDKKMILKPILKKIFIKYFPEKFLFEKQGFSGFPNESGTINKFSINKILLNFFNKHVNTFNKANQWKLLNLNYFINFCKIKFSL
jgi:asparagine synthase (glutamine-hydrolysing)